MQYYALCVCVYIYICIHTYIHTPHTHTHTHTHTKGDSGKEWRKSPWEKMGSVGGPVLLCPDETSMVYLIPGYNTSQIVQRRVCHVKFCLKKKTQETDDDKQLYLVEFDQEKKNIPSLRVTVFCHVGEYHDAQRNWHCLRSGESTRMYLGILLNLEDGNSGRRIVE